MRPAQVTWIALALLLCALQAQASAIPPLTIYKQSGVSGDSLWDLNVTSALGLGAYYRFQLSNPALLYNDATGEVLYQPMDQYFGGLLKGGALLGMKPVFLFNYYPNLPYNGKGVPVGNYTKWFKIGSGFAQRYGEGGSFAKENNLGNFGIGAWTMFNEADICDLAYGQQAWDLNEYYTAVLGLALGIRSVIPAATIFPGGFASPDYFAKPVLRSGFGEILAPLWNNGTLDAIDLHMYTSAPRMHYYLSSMVFFAGIRKAYGISGKISFIATEFNYYTNTSESQLDGARGLLTTAWDVWGAVQDDGRTSATFMALPYDYFSTFPSTSWGLTYANNPDTKTFTLTEKGRVLTLALNLTRGLSFTSLDPFGTGIYVLDGTVEGQHRRLTVWQNRPTFTSLTGSSLDINVGNPPIFSTVEVYNYAGLQQTIAVKQSNVTPDGKLAVGSLQGDQTYMILSVATAAGTIL